jgi:hypothetical protein
MAAVIGARTFFHLPYYNARISYRSSMLEANGLPSPAGRPLLHGGGPVNEEIWPLQEV